MDKLIGRHKEQSILKNCLESGRSEFVVIYGRRRIGKTFLVRRFFNDTYDFSFVGKHDMPREQQLADFLRRNAVDGHSKVGFRVVIGELLERMGSNAR